jgi:hypothetical protein
MEVVDKHKIVTGIYRATEESCRMRAMKMGKLVNLCGETKEELSG